MGVVDLTYNISNGLGFFILKSNLYLFVFSKCFIYYLFVWRGRGRVWRGREGQISHFGSFLILPKDNVCSYPSFNAIFFIFI